MCGCWYSVWTDVFSTSSALQQFDNRIREGLAGVDPLVPQTAIHRDTSIAKLMFETVIPSVERGVGMYQVLGLV